MKNNEETMEDNEQWRKNEKKKQWKQWNLMTNKNKQWKNNEKEWKNMEEEGKTMKKQKTMKNF